MSTSSPREVKIFRSFSIMSPRGTHGTYHQQLLAAMLDDPPAATRRAARSESYARS
jgi:hypothetical protein